MLQDSGADLEQRMGGLHLPEDRWRANIVVEGAEPWEEDLWQQITISDGSGAAVQLVSVRPCDRCKVLFPVLPKEQAYNNFIECRKLPDC